jgi:hypothetical protein
VKKGGICGEYYRKKETLSKMPGTKVLTVAAGHFLNFSPAEYQCIN